MGEAIQDIRTFLKQHAFDAVLLRSRANFAWVTGGGDNHIVNASELGVADLLVTPDSVLCLTNQIESRRIREEELRGRDIEIVASNWYEGTSQEVTSLLAGKRLAADVDLPDTTNVSAQLSGLRRTLNATQIEQYRWVCTETATALEAVCQRIRPGQTEFEVAAELSAEVIRRGLQPTVTLVATDERILNYRHPIPTGKRLERYAMVVVCAEKYGLVGNATRFVHFGSLPSDLTENRSLCAYIDARMNHATRPGRQVGDVFKIAVDAYREVGYPDDWKWLHQGGPTGYASREYLATPTSSDVIQVGQVFAWNPAIRGIKSEDTLLVGPDANEFLTHTGNWPYLTAEVDGEQFHRPDILVRG